MPETSLISLLDHGKGPTIPLSYLYSLELIQTSVATLLQPSTRYQRPCRLPGMPLLVTLLVLPSLLADGHNTVWPRTSELGVTAMEVLLPAWLRLMERKSARVSPSIDSRTTDEMPSIFSNIQATKICNISYHDVLVDLDALQVKSSSRVRSPTLQYQLWSPDLSHDNFQPKLYQNSPGSMKHPRQDGV
jgi:hypothetical protein